MVVDTAEDHLDTSTSTITIDQPRQKHNGQMYNCVAPIPDGVDVTLGDENPVNQSFKLSVHCK